MLPPAAGISTLLRRVDMPAKKWRENVGRMKIYGVMIRNSKQYAFYNIYSVYLNIDIQLMTP